jgi:hypothetical protein
MAPKRKINRRNLLKKLFSGVSNFILSRLIFNFSTFLPLCRKYLFSLPTSIKTKRCVEEEINCVESKHFDQYFPQIVLALQLCMLIDRSSSVEAFFFYEKTFVEIFVIVFGVSEILKHLSFTLTEFKEFPI